MPTNKLQSHIGFSRLLRFPAVRLGSVYFLLMAVARLLAKGDWVGLGLTAPAFFVTTGMFIKTNTHTQA